MTASGRPFWPLNPRPQDICIEDIAHHLSLLCRYTGATRCFYSIAQHSVLVSQACDPADALHGLLHDAAEAYLHDIPRPLKRLPAFAPYREAEARLQAMIYETFGLSPIEPPAVKLIDRRMLRTEQRDLMPPSVLDERRDDVEPYPKRIEPWRSSCAAEALFLKQFGLLNPPVCEFVLDAR